MKSGAAREVEERWRKRESKDREEKKKEERTALRNPG
jgi:hypothetical protein